jgi:hypothetical protein
MVTPWVALTLRRASIARPGGSWSEHDFDVLGGEREVGRMYRVVDRRYSDWFWGVSFQLTGRKSYGQTLDGTRDLTACG